MRATTRNARAARGTTEMTDREYIYDFRNHRGMKPRFRVGDRFEVTEVLPRKANGNTVTYKIKLERCENG